MPEKDKKDYMRQYYEKNKFRWTKRSPEKQKEYNEDRRRKYSEDAELREQCRRKTKEWQAENQDKRFAQRLRKYGITPNDYYNMLDEQDGGCAICGGGDDKTRFHVDHCHSTMQVRGLLCGQCNLGLGKFRDRADLLDAAAAYLLLHSGAEKTWSSAG